MELCSIYKLYPLSTIMSIGGISAVGVHRQQNGLFSIFVWLHKIRSKYLCDFCFLFYGWHPLHGLYPITISSSLELERFLTELFSKLVGSILLSWYIIHIMLTTEKRCTWSFVWGCRLFDAYEVYNLCALFQCLIIAALQKLTL